MDDFEKRVLRKRKLTIEEHVKVDGDLLSAMRRGGVINDDGIAAVQGEKTNYAKLAKIVEIMNASPNLSCFDNFCNAILTTNSDISWLAKELQAEVKADRGNLQIDEDVNREAATIVHRKFGTSKRFGESDKKEIQELIAIKIQVSKEEFRQELEQYRQEAKDKEARYKAKDEQALGIRDRLVHFIRDNETWLTSKAHDMNTTTDILRSSVADDDLLAKMEEVLKHLLFRTERVLKEQELLIEDKHRCMSILGVEEDTAKLHSVLKQKMTDMPDQIKQCKADIDDKNNTIARLRKILSDTEKEINGNEDQIKSLEKELSVLKDTLAMTKEKVTQLEEGRDATPPPSTPDSGAGSEASSRKSTANGTPRSKTKTTKSAGRTRTK